MFPVLSIMLTATSRSFCSNMTNGWTGFTASIQLELSNDTNVFEIFVKHHTEPPEVIYGWSDPAWEAVNNSHTKCAAKFLFLTVRRCSHYTSASKWESKAWKFSHAEHINYYACTLTYVPCRILQQFSLGRRPHKSRTHKYDSPLPENGPAMAGPAGPVPAPMLFHLCML